MKPYIFSAEEDKISGPHRREVFIVPYFRHHSSALT